MTPADIQPTDVQPVAPAAPAAEAAPAPDDSSPQASLPEAVLKIPAMHALLQGAPPATYAPLKSKMPEIKTLEKHADALKKAGFAAFESESMPGNLVFFNGLIIKPEEVTQADKAGKLDSISVPFEQLVESFKGAAKDAPNENVDGATPPAAPAPAPEAAAAPVAVSAPPPAGVEKRIAGARVTNLTPGSPTSGPVPGRGRVLNSLYKPVV